ncbi:MAG: cysteine hydrolase [Acidobacteriota bacterium]
MTARSLARHTAAWLTAVKPYQRFPWGSPVARRTCVLIVDPQRCFFERRFRASLPAAPAIVPNLRRFVIEARSAGARVILTRHAERPREAPRTMAAFWKGTIADGTIESGIIPALADLDFPVVRKWTYDAFHGTSLDARLRRARVEWIVIAGVMTDLCCETTARSAFVRGYSPIVLADATATTTEDLHVSALRTMAHGFAEIRTTSDTLAALR